MALTIIQLYAESADINRDDPQADQEWMVMGTASETPAVVYAALWANLPAAYLGMYLQSFKPRHIGADFWTVGVHYGKAIVLTAGTFKFSGKTSGQQLHREQSLDTVHWFTELGMDGSDAPDFKGLIGVHKDKIDGVDLVGKNFSFTITARFAATAIPPTFIQDLTDLKPSVNDATVITNYKGQILTFEKGELLLADLTFNDPGKDTDGATELFEIIYEFVYSGNQLDGEFALGDIDGILKRGHEYAWTWSLETVTNGYIARKPYAVYIEKVYEYADFAQLRLSS